MLKIFLSLLVLTGTALANADPYPYRFEGEFEELYNSGPFNFLERIIKPTDTVLEAGAFDGEDTLHLAKIVPFGKVISFEPNPPRYEQLVAKTAHLTNNETYPYALGNENGTVIFYVCWGAQNDPVYEGASSVLPPSESMEVNYQGPRIEVPCYRLDDWCKEYNQQKIDFMWLDLEGNEKQVLENSLEILHTVKAIYVETNFYKFREGMTLYPELRQFLESQGFKLLSHGYCEGLQGNAIFVRKTLYEQIVQQIISYD